MFKFLDEQEIFVSSVVLNAADQGLGIKIFENDFNAFVKVINTNVCWNYLIAEQAALRMKEKREGGSIVFINSNTSYRAIPDRIAYETSKSGQLGMMRGLALDLGKYNIRVNAVLPGMIKTDRWEKILNFIGTFLRVTLLWAMWLTERILPKPCGSFLQVPEMLPARNSRWTEAI